MILFSLSFPFTEEKTQFARAEWPLQGHLEMIHVTSDQLYPRVSVPKACSLLQHAATGTGEGMCEQLPRVGGLLDRLVLPPPSLCLLDSAGSLL